MNTVPTLSVQQLHLARTDRDDFILVDVREAFEVEICHLDGVLIPLNELPDRYQELDPSKKIIVHCKSGGRSARAVEFLQQQGFNEVYNLAGGITAWANEIDPEMAQY